MLHGGYGQDWQDGLQVMTTVVITEVVTTVMIVETVMIAETEVASSEPHPVGQRALND